MPKATWKNAVLAETERFETVEGNIYFPRETLRMAHFRPSGTRTFCGWKGEASYYDIVVQGEVNRDAAWYYPDPKPEAQHIKDYVAFWRGVTVQP